MTKMEPKCSMGGTIDEHNISSKFNFCYKCFKCDSEQETKKKCSFWGKSVQEIKAEATTSK